MESTKSIKVVIKVLDATSEKIKWIHLCYLEESLYRKFCEDKQIQPTDFNEVLARWCKEDFDLELSMSSSKDLYLLKGAVKDFYKRAHPDIYVDSVTDRQGWLRVWVTRKIKEELNLYGRE